MDAATSALGSRASRIARALFCVTEKAPRNGGCCLSVPLAQPSTASLPIISSGSSGSAKAIPIQPLVSARNAKLITGFVIVVIVALVLFLEEEEEEDGGDELPLVLLLPLPLTAVVLTATATGRAEMFQETPMMGVPMREKSRRWKE